MPAGLCSKSKLGDGQDAYHPLVIETIFTDPNATFDSFIEIQDVHCPLGAIIMTMLTDLNATSEFLSRGRTQIHHSAPL